MVGPSSSRAREVIMSKLSNNIDTILEHSLDTDMSGSEIIKLHIEKAVR